MIDTTVGFSLFTIGVILMVIGSIGLVMSVWPYRVGRQRR
jgi:hypothetical protein